MTPTTAIGTIITTLATAATTAMSASGSAAATTTTATTATTASGAGIIPAGVGFAFLLTLGAGLSTGLGGVAVLFIGDKLKRMLSAMLGFAGGVMLCISLFELLASANVELTAAYGRVGGLINALIFGAGMLAVILVERILPDADNAPPHSHTVPRTLSLRAGLITALAMILHNFPEGIATFVSAMGLPEAAPAVALAIAVHNIPEGIAVAVPVYIATGSRFKAFAAALVSGLAEPIGALAALTLFAGLMSPLFCAVMFALTAGIMVSISLFTLLPTSDSPFPAIVGMTAIAVVLALT